MKSPRLDEPFHCCPSYRVCSCNACPLDPDYHDHPALCAEEAHCRASLKTRLRIVAALRQDANPAVHHLPFGGLTEKEYKRRQRRERFAALPQEQKDEVMARLKKAQQGLSVLKSGGSEDTAGQSDAGPPL